MAERNTTKIKNLEVRKYVTRGGNPIEMRIEWGTSFGMTGAWLIRDFSADPLKWLKLKPDIFIRHTNYRGDEKLVDYIKSTPLEDLRKLSFAKEEEIKEDE